VKGRHPVHVTMRLRKGLPNLRHRALAGLVFSSFRANNPSLGVRVVHFSVQRNHLHLLVEVDGDDGKRALSRAVQGLAIRLARRLNHRLKRRGSVFADRYHARALRTPLEVRRALVYVLRNHVRHGLAGRETMFDACSTAAYFDGFTKPIPPWPRQGFVPPKEPPVARPRTWLLRVGWRKLGLLGHRDVPARES
jgi:REP element-mobilizing transposase RayT